MQNALPVFVFMMIIVYNTIEIEPSMNNGHGLQRMKVNFYILQAQLLPSSISTVHWEKNSSDPVGVIAGENNSKPGNIIRPARTVKRMSPL